MAALHHQRRHHQIKAPTATWLILKATPPPRDEAKKLAAAAAYSPLLLSPSVRQKAQDGKKSKADCGDVLPTSPRITCMGQVKGRPRRCSGARGGDRPAARGASSSAHRSGKQLLERLTLGLFGRRRGRTSSRACSKVRDVPGCSSASSSLGRSSCGGGAGAVVCTLDPPLPVVRRPAVDDDAPTLWERRRGGGGKALETLRLT